MTDLAGCITQALWVAALFTLRRAGVRHKIARTRIPEPLLTMRQDEYALWVQLGSPPVPMTAPWCDTLGKNLREAGKSELLARKMPAIFSPSPPRAISRYWVRPRGSHGKT